MVARTRSAILIALLLALTVVFFGEVLVGDRVLVTCNTYCWLPWAEYATPDELDDETYRTDAARTYLPRRVHAARSITSGQFPLWNPYILGGSPFFADPQTQVLYPAALLLLPVDAARAMGYDVAIHVFLAMLGMFLFLGAIDANRPGRMLGALAYGLSSFFFLRMGHPTFVAAAAWLPYLFFGYERSKHSVRSGGVLLVVFLSLGYLAGMPQVFIFGVAALLFYAALDCLEALVRREKGAALRNVRVLAVSAAIALLVVGVQLIPFVEFIRNSRGLGFTFEAMSRDHLWSPVFLLRAVIPDLFGNPVEGTSWIGLVKGAVHPYNSGFMVYCGVGGLGLALASLVFLKKSGRTRALFGLLLLSLGAGTSAVFLRMIFTLFPLAAYSQIDRVSVITCFALAALAGKGISLAAKCEDPALRRRFVLVPAVLAGVVACGLAFFGSRGANLISGLSDKAAYMGGEMWFRKSGFRLIEWLNRGGGAEWFTYEMKHIVLGLGFAALSALLTWLYVGYRKHVRLRNVAVWLLGLTLLADLGLAARRYYVTQPAGCLSETEGIELLAEMAGESARWRIGVLGPSEYVLPTNTPQIFGIPAFGGLNALYPEGYADRVAFAASLRHASGPVPPVLGPVGDLMGVRYLVADRPYPELIDSPVMKAMAGDVDLHGRLGVAEVGGERRLSLLLRPGETCSLAVRIPECEYMSFSLGLDGDDRGGPGDPVRAVTVLRARGSGEAWSRSGELRRGAEHWDGFRFDVSKIAGGYARIVFRVPGGASPPGVKVAWSRFEFVKRDCEVKKAGGGYEVIADELQGTLALALEASGGEIPIMIETPAGEGGLETRHVRFAGPGGSAYILIGAGAYGERTMVLSEQDFRILEARLIDTGGGAPVGLSPVYDGDMFIYENSSALPRGICLERSLFGDPDLPDGETGVLETGRFIDRLGSYVCGLASIRQYECGSIVAEVSAAEDCVLLLQDTWYPGWRARVDGVETPVARTDLGVRAVPVERGDHEVVMEYVPGSFRLGLGLSILGVFLGVVYGAKAKRR